MESLASVWFYATTLRDPHHGQTEMCNHDLRDEIQPLYLLTITEPLWSSVS